MKKTMRTAFATTLLAFSLSAAQAAAPERTECIAPAKPGGGFDLTCKLIQVS
ncbi:tripartite tricarboxylate transporter substrate binding protein, partial [Klebsiella pneumoniae]